MRKFNNNRKGPQNLPTINERIRATQVRLISETGEMLGVMPTKEAVVIAKERGFDLVVVNDSKSSQDAPVAKIMDYGKYKFETEKKARDAKKKQHIQHVKELKMRYKIDTHDYLVHVKKAEKFLTHGDKVKVSIPLFGREMEHKHLALNLIQKFVEDVAAWGTPESPPKREGKTFQAVFSPLPPAAKKKKTDKESSEPKTEDKK